MKPTDFLIRAVLACALFASTALGAQAAAEARSRTRFDASEAELQQRLATSEAARVFREYNAAHGQQIQQNLAIVYARDPAFQEDAGGPARPLDDSIVGPVTLKWLAHFCSEYGIVATDPGFAQDVTVSLEHVATIAKAYPNWIAILDSPEFQDWIAAKPAPERMRSLAARRSGAAVQVNALIAQYLKERSPARTATDAAEPLELTYSYDPKRLAKQDDLKLIGQRLRTLAGFAAEDEQAFDAHLNVALDGLPLQPDTPELIKRYSRVDAYGVSPELLLQLRRKGLVEPAVIELAKIENIEYGSASAFERALDDVIDGSEFPDAFARSKRDIVLGARLARYKVSDTLVADMAADAPLTPALAAVFEPVAGIEYPTKALFDSALPWQVKRSLGMCRDPVRDAKHAPQGALPEDRFKALAAALPELRASFDDIARLRAVEGGCDTNQQLMADQRAYEVFHTLWPLLDRKMVLQETHAMPHAAPRADAWATPGCACGRHARDGPVIGFYPLWTDGTKHKLDFGAFTRLDLYGLTADDAGVLRGPPGMNGTELPDDLVALMREAHAHNVSVDWVIARDDWRGWNANTRVDRQATLVKLKASILSLLDRPLPNGRQLLSTLGSLGLDPGPTGGDGVALYLRHFPQVDKDLFDAFVRDLWKAFDEMRPRRRLSLIVDYDELGDPGAYDYRNLIGLVQETNHVEGNLADTVEQRLNDLPVLVMLPEPTHDTKKALRGQIQDALHGEQSARLLRTLVPILEFDGVGTDQLKDDIVYIHDNYFGIGFWPLSFAPSDGAAAGAGEVVNRLVSANFERSDAIPPGLHHAFRLLCPQRLWLRWVFLVTLALALGVGGYYYACRGCSQRLDGSALLFAGMTALMALPAVSFLLLIVSDPLFDDHMLVLLALYVLGGLAVAALTVRHYFNKSRRKLP